MEISVLGDTIAFPGVMAHAQHLALAFYEAKRLDGFVTTIAWHEDRALAKFLNSIPFGGGRRLSKQLSRRSIPLLPEQYISEYPQWEIARIIASRVFASPVWEDRIWDHGIHQFDQYLAERYIPRTEVIHGFEYSVLEAFKRAAELGVGRVLHLASLDNIQFSEVERREKERWPELKRPWDAYFEGKIQERYLRRCSEMQLADVIVANSTLTARSHITAGADPKKVFVVPLGAPVPIHESEIRPNESKRPLRVLWAGPFSLRKGAHYLLEAWSRLAAADRAFLDVYGQIAIPESLKIHIEGGITFHGSVPQAELFKAYKDADILIFPTLSDGFGMVITEALAHGLPVITTDQAGAVDLLSPQNSLIVPAANSTALTDSLHWCLDNRRQLADMRVWALKAARKRSWAHFRSDIIEAVTLGLNKAGHSHN